MTNETHLERARRLYDTANSVGPIGGVVAAILAHLEQQVTGASEEPDLVMERLCAMQEWIDGAAHYSDCKRRSGAAPWHCDCGLYDLMTPPDDAAPPPAVQGEERALDEERAELNWYKNELDARVDDCCELAEALRAADALLIDIDTPKKWRAQAAVVAAKVGDALRDHAPELRHAPQPTPPPATECAHKANKLFPVVTHWDGRHYQRKADWCVACGAMVFSDEVLRPQLSYVPEVQP